MRIFFSYFERMNIGIFKKLTSLLNKFLLYPNFEEKLYLKSREALKRQPGFDPITFSENSTLTTLLGCQQTFLFSKKC